MKDITMRFLDNIKFAADCAIKEPDSIYAQEFFMLLDETFGNREDYKQAVQAVAVSWFIERVKELEQRAEAAEEKLAEYEKQNTSGWQFEECESEKCTSGAVVNVHGADAHLCAECSRDKKYSRMKITALPKRLSRPTPAVSLAELVPQRKPITLDAPISAEWAARTSGYRNGFNDCVDEIIRNIEEAQ